MNATAIEWVVADDCPDDVEVAEAVCEWLASQGRSVPVDFWDAVAVFERPAGTSFQDYQGYWGEKLAQEVRVTIDGTPIVLRVGWGNSCGCPECGGRPTYEVVS